MGWPFAGSRLAGFLNRWRRQVVAAVHVRGITLKLSHSYVQDIFTIRPIAIKYRYGVAAPEIFRGGRRGAALRACIAQIASGSAGAFPTDPGFGRRSWFQTFRSVAARSEVKCSRQAIS